MTKLKTLKDIYEDDEWYNDFGVGHKHRLRQEVIKWIKEIKVNMPDMMTIQTGRFSTRDRAIRGQGKIQFIMKFFNITDKELE